MQTITVLAFAQDISLCGFHIQVTDTLTFTGNLIGLGATAGKTVYDLSCNQKRYLRERGDPPPKAPPSEPAGAPKASAAQVRSAWVQRATKALMDKHDRADLATLLTFVALGVGFLLSALAVVHI
jgi:hypothetical protein